MMLRGALINETVFSERVTCTSETSVFERES